MPTCLWTHETSDRAIPVVLDVPSDTGGAGTPRTLYVLPEHEADLRAYNDRVKRWGRVMLVAVLGLSGVLLAVAFGAEAAGWTDRTVAVISGAVIVAMSGLLVALPFATPQTIDMMGVRASIRLVRGLAVVIAALGVGIAVYG